MKSKVSFSSNSIKIKTPIAFLLIYTIFGALLGGTGIFYLGEINPFDHILAGLGIIVFFSGLFSLLNSKYYKILINEDPGYLSLVESTGWDISPLKIPYKYFTEIVAQYIVNRNKPEYGVLLKNRMGALLLVAKFHNEKDASGFKNKFEKTIGLPVKENSEIPLDMIDTKHYNPYGIVLPQNSSIKITERRDSLGIAWKIKYHPLQIAFMFVIYYGFYHLISFAIVPAAKLNVSVIIVIYTVMGVILSFLITAVVSNYFGTHYVIINRDTITYFNKIVGRRFGEMVMMKKDISLVRSSIEFSNEDMIIASRDGVAAVNSVIKRFSTAKKDLKKTVDVQDKNVFRKEIIKLNVSNLKLAEKLFIEQFILKNL